MSDLDRSKQLDLEILQNGLRTRDLSKYFKKLEVNEILFLTKQCLSLDFNVGKEFLSKNLSDLADCLQKKLGGVDALFADNETFAKLMSKLDNPKVVDKFYNNYLQYLESATLEQLTLPGDVLEKLISDEQDKNNIFAKYILFNKLKKDRRRGLDKFLPLYDLDMLQASSRESVRTKQEADKFSRENEQLHHEAGKLSGENEQLRHQVDSLMMQLSSLGGLREQLRIAQIELANQKEIVIQKEGLVKKQEKIIVNNVSQIEDLKKTLEAAKKKQRDDNGSLTKEQETELRDVKEKLKNVIAEKDDLNKSLEKEKSLNADLLEKNKELERMLKIPPDYEKMMQDLSSQIQGLRALIQTKDNEYKELLDKKIKLEGDKKDLSGSLIILVLAAIIFGIAILIFLPPDFIPIIRSIVFRKP